MTTEQWLTDLEAKAKAAVANWEKKYGDESDEAITQLAASMDYIDAANPSAVLRLVALVRIMADWLEDKAMLQEINDSGNLKWSALSARDWLENAYTAAEKNNDQS